MQRFMVEIEYKPYCPFPTDVTINRVQVIADTGKHALDLAMERVSRSLEKRGVKGVLFKGSRPIPIGRKF